MEIFLFLATDFTDFGFDAAFNDGLCAPAYSLSKNELFQDYTARAQLLRNECQSLIIVCKRDCWGARREESKKEKVKRQKWGN